MYLCEGERTLKCSAFDIRGAVLRYQYSERIKSEFIVAGKLLRVLSELKNDQLFGAEKVMSSFSDALIGEVEAAYKVTGLRIFRETSLKITEVQGGISLHEYSKANNLLSEALSLVTTSGHNATQLLIEKGCL